MLNGQEQTSTKGHLTRRQYSFSMKQGRRSENVPFSTAADLIKNILLRTKLVVNNS